MARLEELTPNAAVRGILPNGLVTVVNIQWHGSAALELTYKTPEGRVANELLYRHDEPRIEVVEQGRPWSFDGDGALFRLVSEAQRIRLAHLFDPVLAVHTSLVDPLPHQITAVYEAMLPRQPLRFLLADDPGAGKTIMAGLLIKELIARGDLKRCLIVGPGSLVEQWQDELSRKFQLPFEIMTNDKFEAARTGNWFVENDLAIARLDKLSRHEDVQAKLSAPDCHWDLVVVDEASMLSSSLMYRLLAALSKDTHLLLVGDPDQLASVDAGSVLADIASSAARAGSALHSRTTTLMERHRFGADIGKLADAILAGSPAETLAVLTAGLDAVTWIEPGQDRVAAVAAEVGAHASHLRNLAAGGDAAAVLEAQKRLQVLCAHRDGPTGVSGWNARIEKGLGMLAGDSWYPGRPVMVTRNNRALKLFNGDAGIVIPAAGDRMEAVFGQPGSMLRVPVTRLEDVATMHAITIHKSQGSEYGHAIVVLPEARSRLLTRELLYTGVTRAVDKVTVIGSREVIEAAVSHPIRRASGLASRL